MRTYRFGSGDPVISLVACLHGDEPCGLAALELVRERADELEQPVQVIVANEKALQEGQRAIDEDLNRTFPGDPAADTHERRLAAQLADTVAGTTVLDLHATPSEDPPFCVVDGTDSTSLRLCRQTGLERAVDISMESGGLIQHHCGISVECGMQGTDEAAANAARITGRFLQQQDALHGTAERSDPVLFSVTGAEQRQSAQVFTATNFQKVQAGEQYATVDGRSITADEPFYPVLMSTDGYDDILGFKAKRLGRLSGLSTQDF